MHNSQITRIEEMLMMIPTQMCRNMDQRFSNVILKGITAEIAKHHFMIMRILFGKEKLFVTEIVQTLGITKSQMTSSIDKLLKLGYVERWPDTTDRRKIYVSITKDGERITDRINTRMKERFYEDIKTMSSQELTDLEKGLKVLRKLCSSCK